VIGYLAIEGNCVDTSPTIPYSKIPPFALPSNSTYKGKAVVNGIRTTIWNVTNFQVITGVEVSGLVYIGELTNMFVQMVSDVPNAGTVTALFSGCVYSPIPANTFAKPQGC